jgi:hypothetical protein
MPTYTASNGFIKQDLASNVNRWGDPILNQSFDLVDDSLDGILTLNGAAPSIVLTNDNGAPNQARNRILRVTGVQAANCIITVPNVAKHWWVWNQTTGGSFAVTVRTAAGAGVVCARGGKTLVVCDSIDCFQFAPGSLSDLSPPTGDLNLNNHRIISLADGTNSNHAATLGQVTASLGAPNPSIQYLLQLALS